MNTCQTCQRYPHVRPDHHAGPAQIRTYLERYVSVLCSQGHLVEGVLLADWAGSALQARVGRGEVVCCHGSDLLSLEDVAASLVTEPERRARFAPDAAPIEGAA